MVGANESGGGGGSGASARVSVTKQRNTGMSGSWRIDLARRLAETRWIVAEGSAKASPVKLKGEVMVLRGQSITGFTEFKKGLPRMPS